MRSVHPDHGGDQSVGQHGRVRAGRGPQDPLRHRPRDRARRRTLVGETTTMAVCEQFANDGAGRGGEHAAAVPGGRGRPRPVDARRRRAGRRAGVDDGAGRLPVPQGGPPGARPAAEAAGRRARRAGRHRRRRRSSSAGARWAGGCARWSPPAPTASPARRPWPASWRSPIRCTRRASPTRCASSTCRRSTCRACSSTAPRTRSGHPTSWSSWTATIAGAGHPPLDRRQGPRPQGPRRRGRRDGRRLAGDAGLTPALGIRLGGASALAGPGLRREQPRPEEPADGGHDRQR